jgi:hypothetical protein
MWYLCLLVLLQPVRVEKVPPPGQPNEPPAAATPEKQPTTAPTFDEGPLRCELSAMFDARYWYLDEQPRSEKPELRMRWLVRGERIDQVVRRGNLIFSEAVDDTGRTLVGPDTYTEEQRTITYPLSDTPAQLRAQGLPFVTRVDSPARGAKSVKFQGTLRIMLAPQREEVTIQNPLQFAGKTIENDRLKELGIVIRLVPAEDVDVGDQPATQFKDAFVFQYVQNRDKVNSAALYDAWMKRMRYREQPSMKTKQGEPVTVYALGKEGITEETQFVLEVFPKFEDVTIRVDLDSVTLP